MYIVVALEIPFQSGKLTNSRGEIFKVNSHATLKYAHFIKIGTSFFQTGLRIILFTVEASVGGENYIVEDPFPVGID